MCVNCFLLICCHLLRLSTISFFGANLLSLYYFSAKNGGKLQYYVVITLLFCPVCICRYVYAPRFAQVIHRFIHSFLLPFHLIHDKPYFCVCDLWRTECLDRCGAVFCCAHPADDATDGLLVVGGHQCAERHLP